MKIRSKLSWTFILLIIFGITAISSYAILFIRSYMLEEGEKQIKQDAQWMAVTIGNLERNDAFDARLNKIGRSSNYQLTLHDSTGRRIAVYPDSLREELPRQMKKEITRYFDRHPDSSYVINKADSAKIAAYAYVESSDSPARYIHISQFKENMYRPIKTIRWIIYYGMFISIALVIVVSLWISRYLTRPITQIKDAAKEIADGDVERQIDLNRRDEFETLAKALNRMASRLRADAEQFRRLNERQRQFFADITHELKNPLHTLMGSLEMLEMDSADEQMRKNYIRKARSQAERIDRLFRDLVTLQRYDSDEYFVEKRVFDLSTITDRIKEWYEEKAAEKGLMLNVRTDSCSVVGDPDKLEQVLDNLVSNAVKYTNEGEIEIDYKVEEEEDLVTISVKDTGIGIAPEHEERLFDRFYRTDKARSRDKGGTGLGLSVVKSILDAHDTEIEIDSTPGEGTIFRFSLPKA